MSKPILGILGGGQLGSMLATAAKKLNVQTTIYCDDENAPAQKFADNFISDFSITFSKNLDVSRSETRIVAS